MVKKDLIRTVAENTGVNNDIVVTVIENTMDAIKQTLINDEPLYLRGFGSFQNKHRKARPGRNFKAKSTVMVPERKVPIFYPCKELKHNVNKQ